MSNQTPVTHRYYPRLSSVVTKDDIPDILGFIKDGVINLLDTIYYKDLQYRIKWRFSIILQKIEELTLYVISQNKEIEKLKATIKV